MPPPSCAVWLGVPALRRADGARVATFQTLTVRSKPAEASLLPSGAKATELTVLPCPNRVVLAWPLARSHTLIVRSSPAEARVLPSGEKATEDRPSVWPLRVAFR